MKWIGPRLQQATTAFPSLIFILFFFYNFYAVISNGHAAASMAAFSKDLESSYPKISDLFDKKEAAANDAKIAAFDAKKDSSRQRDEKIAGLKLDNSTNAFNLHAGEFNAKVCAVILEMQNLSAPASWFMRDYGVHECDTKREIERVVLAQGSLRGIGLDTVAQARQGAVEVLLLESFYVLPLLFGTFGAFLYCIRSLFLDSSKLNDPICIRSFGIRVTLGGIVGFVIGYFGVSLLGNAGESASVATAPLLFSLAAGFSIEPVVLALERVARGIGEKDSSPPQQLG